MMIVELSVMYTVTVFLGLAAGSFLNVVILRTHQQTSPWLGRSKCMSCGHALSWHELLPLASFLWLRGKCRHCSARLSWQYPLVEAVTALLFALVASRFGLTWWTLWGFVVVGTMVAIAVYDARWSLLPDAFSIFLGAIGVVMAVVMKIPLIDIGLGLVAGASFFGLQHLVSRGRWVGSGDILLGGALGALLGWRMFGLSLLLAYFSGAIVASLLLLLRRKKVQGTMAFGPYLVFGGFIAWLWGEHIIVWYFNNAIFM